MTLFNQCAISFPNCCLVMHINNMNNTNWIKISSQIARSNSINKPKKGKGEFICSYILGQICPSFTIIILLFQFCDFGHIFPKRSKLVKLTLEKWNFPSQLFSWKENNNCPNKKHCSTTKVHLLYYKVEDQSKGVKLCLFLSYIFLC